MKKQNIQGGESFSCDFYKEIDVHNLQKEYNKTIIELIDYKVKPSTSMIFVNPIIKDYRLQYREQLIKKCKAIKDQLKLYVQDQNLRPKKQNTMDWVEDDYNDHDRTQEDFALVASALKTEGSYYRLKSVYCYDILEQYDQVKKVTMKLRKFDGRKSLIT